MRKIHIAVAEIEENLASDLLILLLHAQEATRAV